MILRITLLDLMMRFDSNVLKRNFGRIFLNFSIKFLALAQYITNTLRINVEKMFNFENILKY
jgi:hypothetical protein